jgi:hypothetical protein
VARSQIADLSTAPVGWMLVCPSRQLSTTDAKGVAHRAMVLSRGASDVQPAAGLPRRPTARLARFDRGERDRGAVGQEPGSCRRLAPRARRCPARSDPLAAPSGPSGRIGPRRRRPPRTGPIGRYRHWPRPRIAQTSSLTADDDPGRYSSPAWFRGISAGRASP